MGAQCNGVNCIDLNSGVNVDATYYQVMKDGLNAGPAIYFEALPADVPNDPYPDSFAAGAPQY